jgi:hypothetical protein
MTSQNSESLDLMQTYYKVSIETDLLMSQSTRTDHTIDCHLRLHQQYRGASHRELLDQGLVRHLLTNVDC